MSRDRPGGHGGPRRPDRQKTLLLEAALSADERCLEALREFSAAGGELLEPDRETAALLPLLSRNLVALGADVPGLPLLKGVYRKAWYSNVTAIQLAVGALDDLAAAGISTLILGGAALAELHYRELAVRPFGQVDVLVAPGTADRAREVLFAAGWHCASGDAESNLAHRGERFEHPGRGAVGLRWRALADPIDERPLWEAAVGFELLERSTLALAPTDQLLDTCVEGLRWGPEPATQWAADAATLVLGGGIDWHRLMALGAGGVSMPLFDALAYLDGALALPVPAETLAALRAAPSRRRRRLAYRAGLKPPRPLRTLAVHWDRHRSLREPGGGGRGFPSFAHYLAGLWRLPSPWQVPVEAFRQLIGRPGADRVRHQVGADHR